MILAELTRNVVARFVSEGKNGKFFDRYGFKDICALIFADNFDDDALSRVCILINVARYTEFRLRQWSDDVDFLEMKVAENDCSNHGKGEHNDNSCFFEKEIRACLNLKQRY